MDWVYLLSSFEGRISRKTFWIAIAVLIVAELAGYLIAQALQGDRSWRRAVLCDRAVNLRHTTDAEPLVHEVRPELLGRRAIAHARIVSGFIHSQVVIAAQ